MLIIFLISSCLTISQNDKYHSSLDNQIEELSTQFVKTLSSENKSTLAIMDFVELDGKQSILGKYLREELTIRIFKSGKVSVVERGMLEEVMEEWNFGAKGYVSEKTASRIGQLLGVEAITIGTITDLGDSLKINARIIEVETGKVISVASTTLIKDSSILTLMGVLNETEEPVVVKEDKETVHRSVKNSTKYSKLSFIQKGMKFDFTRAEFNKGDNNLKLSGTVTALETDKIFYFKPNSIQIISDSGNSYYGQSMKVGLVEASFYLNSRYVDLVEGIPTSIEVNIGSFEKIPSKIIRLQIYNSWREKQLGYFDYSVKPDMDITLIN